MEKYLQELIQHQNRIIIPDFGAFIVSRDNGQHILFNNFLSFNDGLLVSHICEAEGINSDQALEKVRGFIDKVQAALKKDGRYTIPKIGTLTQSDGGSITFEAEAVPQEAKQASAESTVVKKEKEEKLDNKEKKEKKEDTSLVEKSELLDLDVSKQATPPKSTAVKAEKKPTPAEPKKEVVVEQKVVNKESEKTPTVLINNEYNSSRHPKWLWILLILLLLLIGCAVIYFFTDIPNKLGIFNTEKSQTEVVEESPAPELVPLPQPVDSSAIDKKIEEEPVESALETGTRLHYVVVGAFKKEADAIDYKEKIISQGLNSATILMHEGMYLVSSDSYSSVSTALRRQEELLKTHRLENWVLSITVE